MKLKSINDDKFVKVIIRDGNKVLKHYYIDDGMYDIPAGKVETGESLVDAAVRELLERTGYKILPSDLKHNGFDDGFDVFVGDAINATKVAGPGELGGYRTTVKWE